MKKIISLFLSLSIAILSVTACNSQITDGTSSSTQSNEPAKTSSTSYTATATTNVTTQKPEDPDITLAPPNSLIFNLDFSSSSFKDGKYEDLSGNGHHGIVHGTLTNENGSVKFDGSGASYISVPDHPDLNFTAKQSFTLVVRFKAEPIS